MIKLFCNICLFRKAPEAIPYSLPLLLGLIAICFAVESFFIILLSGSVAYGLSRTLVLIVVQGIAMKGLLQVRGFPERFLQAFAAILATQAVIVSLCLIPYLVLLSLLPETSSNVLYYSGLTVCASLLLGLSFWLYVVYSYILESALIIKLNQSLTLTVGIFSLITLLLYAMQLIGGG